MEKLTIINVNKIPENTHLKIILKNRRITPKNILDLYYKGHFTFELNINDN